jgi:hypothetical protein
MVKRALLVIAILGAVVAMGGPAASSSVVAASSSDANGDGKADVIAVSVNGIFACLSTGTGFTSISSWTAPYHAFYGSIGTFFADVTGDGKADAIAVSNNSGYYASGNFVRVSNGSAFTFPTSWSGRFYGTHGTAFADVDGNGKADAIAVNNNRISVLLSTGTRFASQRYWTLNPFYGSFGTFFADVNGDGRSDAIALNREGIAVRLSNGTTFGGGHYWLPTGYYGARGTFFADVDGDGKADVIVVNGGVTYDGIQVRLSTGTGFGISKTWAPSFYGSRGTFIGDVNGDGKADAVAVNGNSTSVRVSSGSAFTQGRLWGNTPCYGNLGTIVA